MLILLPIYADDITTDKLLNKEQILWAEETGVRTQLTLIGGSTAVVNMTFTNFQQYCYDAQIAYSYETAIIPV